MNRSVESYLVLEARGYGRAAVVRHSKSRPVVYPEQIAIRIRLEVPDEAFKQWIPTVEATVSEPLIVQPTIAITEPEPADETETEEAVPA